MSKRTKKLTDVQELKFDHNKKYLNVSKRRSKSKKNQKRNKFKFISTDKSTNASSVIDQFKKEIATRMREIVIMIMQVLMS